MRNKASDIVKGNAKTSATDKQGTPAGLYLSDKESVFNSLVNENSETVKALFASYGIDKSEFTKEDFKKAYIKYGDKFFSKFYEMLNKKYSSNYGLDDLEESDYEYENDDLEEFDYKYENTESETQEKKIFGNFFKKLLGITGKVAQTVSGVNNALQTINYNVVDTAEKQRKEAEKKRLIEEENKRIGRLMIAGSVAVIAVLIIGFILVLK